ncbi:MAG TPA: dienelactone hydrolase family protein [Patescibacteria group bacterium]|nr:dienelactone hydrolase family protein [Patescibacteria group bacterium]
MRHPVPVIVLAVALAFTPAGVAAADSGLPPGENDARQALDKSPRHGEFIDIKLSGADKPLHAWVVYPERKDKAPVVIVIHEIFGLSDWIRGLADRLAADGFIAVAPDLLSGKGPAGGGTDSVGTRDDVVKLIRTLTHDEVSARLDAVREWAGKVPSGNGRLATIGFCWGGGVSFGYAAATPSVGAAVVYYGTSPESDALSGIKAPVLGLYGGDDARVTATIEPAAVQMKKLGKTYEVEIYDGAGHGFLRDQAGHDGGNLKATQKAWPRTIEFLRKQLGEGR